MSSRSPSLRVAALAVAAVVGASACSSTPSPRRVALDTIEALGLPADQEQCMKDVVATYDNDTLEDLGEANENLNFESAEYVSSGSPEFQAYVEQLQGCVTVDEGSGATEPGATSEAAGTTGAGTTESSDTTD